MESESRGKGDSPKKKVVLLIPLGFDDGTPVPEEELYSIGLRLCQLCGGASMAGTVEGLYRMSGGKRQADKNLLIWVWIASSRLDELRDLVRQFGRELQQESMYFEISDSEIEFIS